MTIMLHFTNYCLICCMYCCSHWEQKWQQQQAASTAFSSILLFVHCCCIVESRRPWAVDPFKIIQPALKLGNHLSCNSFQPSCAQSFSLIMCPPNRYYLNYTDHPLRMFTCTYTPPYPSLSHIHQHTLYFKNVKTHLRLGKQITNHI